MKIFFSKIVPQRGFSDKLSEFSFFFAWPAILDIYSHGLLIDFSDNKEKDLIDFSDNKEKDLIPQPQTKHRKYKELRDEDLIPTNNTALRDGTARPNGVNILRNIVNYPTKNILGLSLTPNLKQKIKNLDSEASFGLANIISSLITANREKRTMRKNN